MAGKRRAYALLVEALKAEVVALGPAQGATSDVLVTIGTPYGNNVWNYPFCNTSADYFMLEKHTSYGEAEAQVVMCVERLVAMGVGPIVVVTIDTDILLQTMGIWARNVYVYLAKVWVVTEKKKAANRNSIGMYRTLTKAKAAAKKIGGSVSCQAEFVSCNAVRRFLGPTAKQAVNAMVWMLLAGGVDYNSGIGAFGWYSSTCLGKHKVSVVDEISCERVVLNLHRLFAELGRSRDRKTKDASAALFVDELNKVLYCVAYYVWFDDGQSPVAGPTIMPYVTPPTAGTTVSHYVATRPRPVTVLNLHKASKFPLTVVRKREAAYNAYVADGVCR